MLAVPLLGSVMNDTRWLEASIVEELDISGLTVFCIANPRDPLLLPGALRLSAPESEWIVEAEALARSAKVIVLHLSDTSGGLMQEIELLRRDGLNEKTIVVLKRGVRLGPDDLDGFDLMLNAPSTSIWTQSMLGPWGGPRFLRRLRPAIDTAVSAS